MKPYEEPKNNHEEIWNQIFSSGIKERFKIERVSKEEYWNIFQNNLATHYPSELMFIRDELLSKNEKEKRQKLNYFFTGNPISDHLVVKEQEKVIAMFSGYQKDCDTYYMQHSIVHKNYRSIGIYSEYITKVLDYTNKLGFLQITSCHSPVNNDVLTLKLKKGFYIASMEIDPELGINIWLNCFLQEELKKAFFFRCGMIEFSKSLFQNSLGGGKKLLNIIDDSSKN